MAAAARKPAREPDALDAIDALPSDAPDPIEHATPDAELAEAQLAMGRPELAEVADGAAEEAELAAEEAELEAADEDEDVDDEALGGDGALAAPASVAVQPRPRAGNRLVNFVQGSWRELQRVQWPDRRQVMQATGVVIGFVIIAGVFLGVADFFAGKVVNYVLTGHFK